MRRFIATMGALLCVTLGTAAAADDVWGTRSPNLSERAHSAQLTMFPGHARLTVRRTVHNGGERHDQAVFRIDVPEGAVAVGLRTLGAVAGRPQWFAGELMDAEQAQTRYRELTGLGPALPKDPALLAWRNQRELTLQVFPVAPGAPKTIEYTYLLPTEYRRGAHHLVLPAMGTEKLRATLSGRTAHGDKLLVDGKPQTHEVIAATGKDIDVALVPRRAPTIGGALAVVPFGAGSALTRFRIEAAPRLSTVPQQARIVVLIDTSRSVKEHQLAAQLAAAKHYLQHFDDAQVEVLTFDRKVRERHRRFVPAAQAARDLAAIGLTRNNGSEVEDALLRAHSLLGAVPRHHPRRILLLTDTLTRRAISGERLRASVDRGTILHVGTVFHGPPSLTPTDHEWSELARSTGGLVWLGAANPDPKHETAMRHVFEELVRPVRLHNLSVAAPRVRVELQLDEVESLDEGESIAASWIDEEATPWLKVEGELWTRRVSRVMRPDAAEGKRWSALVFGSEVMNELSDADMKTLAMHGGAVSPVTSYLAIEPGVRPSTEGLETGLSSGAGGFGLRGVGTGRAGVDVDGSELQHFLETELDSARLACGITARGTDVSLETTFAEIVAVQIEGTASQAQKSCMEVTVWALQLPDMFRSRRSNWNVRV